LVIAVCAVLGEAESFEDIALYGRCKQEWLQRLLELLDGLDLRGRLVSLDALACRPEIAEWTPSVIGQ
jgi:hypothetical protein